MSRPLVKDGLRLDVHKVAKALPHNDAWQGWSWTVGGERRSGIGCRILRDADDGRTLELSYTCDGRPFLQSFRLEAVPCRFGGQRWFARCPWRGALVSKLYCIGGAGFHSRHVYGGLAYACQRDAHERDRALRRRDRLLFGKLRGQDAWRVTKPKWMRWSTFDRLMAKLNAAEAECDRHLDAMAARLCP